MFIFYALLPYVCFSFLCWVKFCSGCFRQVFFIWETKKVVAGRVRQVVVLCSKDCMGDLLGRTQHWSSYTSVLVIGVVV